MSRARWASGVNNQAMHGFLLAPARRDDFGAELSAGLTSCGSMTTRPASPVSTAGKLLLPESAETLDVRFDLAGLGQSDDLDQLGKAAPIRGRHRALIRHGDEVEGELSAGQSDHRQMALLPTNLRGQRQGVIGSDEIDHELDTLAAGQFQDCREASVPAATA